MDSVGLLDRDGPSRVSSEETAGTSTNIVHTLCSLGIPVTLEEVREGPTVTLYGLKLGATSSMKQVAVLDSYGNNTYNDKGHIVTRRERVDKRATVNQLKARLSDLKVALGTNDIRLEAPIEGTDLVGIEVPNGVSSLIPLRYVMERAAMLGPLAVGLGEAASGEAVSIDLAKMPHLLIAGATGSGKSVCINALLASLLVTHTPGDLRLLLIDPKRVELAPYEDIPHLMAPVVTDVRKATPMLNMVIHEMSSRYKLLHGAGVRNITTHNDKVDDGDKLPYIVVVIDELADLMMTAGKKVEEHLCRIAQMGRAVGIHLVVATQRPSVDVITGLIKANFPSRISFAVASSMDSRTVLDASGAEKLLGKGDMLYQAVDMSRPLRIQGCFVSDEEVVAVTDHWRGQAWTPTLEHTDHLDEIEDPDVARAVTMLKHSIFDGHHRFHKSELTFVLGYSEKKADSVTEELVALGAIEHDDGGDEYRISAVFDLSDLRKDEHNRILSMTIAQMKDWADTWADMASDEQDYFGSFDISEYILQEPRYTEDGEIIYPEDDELVKELTDMGLIVPVDDGLYRFDRVAFEKSDRVKEILA